MTKILIIADTHGNTEAVEKLDQIMSECDIILHLGDGVNDVLNGKYKDKLQYVYGNCDGGTRAFKIVEVEKVKILITHGHFYHVKNDLTSLMFLGEEQNVNMVCFGHTHNAIKTTNGKITYINPGTLNSSGYTKTYAYAVVMGDKIVSSIVELK